MATISELSEAVRLAAAEAERAEAHRVAVSKLPVIAEHRRARLAAASASDRARAAHCDALRALRAATEAA